MKKLLSMTMALVMIFSLLPLQSAVLAEGDYTVNFFNTIEDESTISSAFGNYLSSAPYCVDSEAFVDDVSQGNVLRFDSADGKGGVKVIFDEAVDIAENTYIEVEFDFCRTFTGTEEDQVKFLLNGNSFIMIGKSDIKVENYQSASNSKISNFSESGNMQRFKVTFKAAEVDEGFNWQVVSFMIDGVEKVTSGETFTSKVTSELSDFTLRYGTNKHGTKTYLDNISVASYVSEDGVSPVPDKYPLLKKIREADEAAKTSFDNGEITEDFYNKVNATIKNALLVLQTVTSTEADFDEQIASLDNAIGIINVYKNMKENGVSYYIDEENATILGDIELDDEITVKIPAYVAENAVKTVKLMGIIYKDSTYCATPGIEDVLTSEVQIGADTTDNTGVLADNIEMTFDLSAYSDRNGLSAKVFAVDDYSDITDGIAMAQAATKEDPAVGDGYSFTSDVNVSQVAVDDNSELLKIVYALKGTPGSKVSVLASKTAEEQESDAFDGISENPKSVIEYYNTAVFDENGQAVFEFIPESGEGYYDYVINYEDDTPYKNKVLYGTASEPGDDDSTEDNEDEENNHTVRFFNTFEDKKATEGEISSYNSGEYELDEEVYADTAGNGKVLKMVSDGGKKGIYINFDEAISISEDVYVELELDFAFKKVSSDNQMKICINSTNYILFLMNNSFRTEGPDATISSIDCEKLSRYKITLKPEVKNETRVWSIVGLSVDGKNVISEGASYPSDNAKTDISKLCLRFGGGNKDDVIYLDNISVSTYYSEDGVSPVPDKYSLLKKIRETSDAAAASFNSGEISEGILSGINEKVNEAVSVLQTITATKADFSEQIENLDSVADIISAYKKLKENGASYYIDEENATVSGNVASDDKVSVNIPVYTAAGEAKTAFKLMGIIYKDNADCATPEIADILTSEVQINPDTIGNAGMTFDLSSYSDRSGLSMKVFVVDDYSDITDGMAMAQAATKEDLAVGEGYSFVSDVNVSKVILNDDPDTEDFKIVYALKGTPGTKVSVLVSKSATAQESGAFDGISENPKSVIEYYNTAVFDENGQAVFEFVPESGMGYYDYVINYGSTASPYEGKVFYASLSDINTVIKKLYTNKTLNSLSEEEKDTVSLNDPIISEAQTAGVSVDNVLNETLSEKTYDARTLSELTASLYKKLNIAKLFRTSDSADAVMLLRNTYVSDVEALSQIASLSTSQKQQTAYTYIYNNNKSIVDMATLKSVIENAVKEANKNSQSTGSTSSGGGGGGGSYASVVTPTVKDEQELTVMQQATAKFNDLDSVSWAKEAIAEFAANGWIDGKADGVFAPMDKITREEFVKLAVNVFGFYDENAVCGFADADQNQWYYPYVASAAAKEIVNGISDTHFGVGQTVSRQDMAVIIYRIALMNKLNLTEDGEYIPFADEVKIGDYALEAVVELAKSGVINGADNNSFLPNGLATRAEAVKMIYGAYKLQ